MNGLSYLWRYFLPLWPRLLFAYACMLLLAGCTALLAFLTGPAIRFIFTAQSFNILWLQDGKPSLLGRLLPSLGLSWLQNHDWPQQLWFLPCCILLLACFKGLAQAGQFYNFGQISQKVALTLREQTFSNLLQQSPLFFQHYNHGDLLSRLTGDIQTVEQAIFYGLGPLLRDSLAIVGLLLFCFFQDPLLAAVLLLLVPICLFPLKRFSQSLKGASSDSYGIQASIYDLCHESILGIQLVQSHNQEETELNNLRELNQKLSTHQKRSYWIKAIRTPTIEWMASCGLAGLLFLLAYQVHYYGSDAAHYISFCAAIVLMYEPLKKLGTVSDYLTQGGCAAQRIAVLLWHRSDIQEKKAASQLYANGIHIKMHRLCFAYDKKNILDNVSLDIAAGTTLALLGKSGAGKSTLVHLLLRFYEPQQGLITFNNIAIDNFTLHSLRQNISFVSQNIFLFNSSVYQNIAYGKAEATEKQIITAAKDACAHEFIMQLPQGYQTIIGSQGQKLSGGQRQRLAMARAFLRQAPILLLDEATNQLDAENEHAVQTAILRLLPGKTAIIIAHRLATIRYAHHIAILGSGRIIEQGSHEELLQHNGLYSQWHHLQHSHVGYPQPTLQP